MKIFAKKVFKIFEYFQNKKKNLALLSLPEFEGITLIDIGAAGDIEPRWKSVEKNLNYIGFEPDARSANILMNKKSPCKSYKIHPDALLDVDGEINLNLSRKPQVSSIYSPNIELLSLFPDPKRFDVLETKTIKTKKLDHVEIHCPDFLKLDIQGAELKALMGGKKTLDEAFGLEIEVEFLPLYTNQPLFGDVTSFLSKNHFEFIDFVNLYRWERGAHNGHGQCVFGDALYLKSPEVISKKILSNNRISSYIGILLLYKRFDLIRRMLEILPEEQRKFYSKFEEKIIGMECTHNLARKISSLTSQISRFIDADSRNHFLY